MIFMNLTILTDLITQLLLRAIVIKVLKDPFYDGKNDDLTRSYNVMLVTRDVVFQIMLLVNLNVWAYYNILINEQTQMSKNKLNVV